jgi:hypothetical protein
MLHLAPGCCPAELDPQPLTEYDCARSNMFELNKRVFRGSGNAGLDKSATQVAQFQVPGTSVDQHEVVVADKPNL